MNDVIDITITEPSFLVMVLVNVLPLLYIFLGALLIAFAVYAIAKHLRKKRKRRE